MARHPALARVPSEFGTVGASVGEQLLMDAFEVELCVQGELGLLLGREQVEVVR